MKNCIKKERAYLIFDMSGGTTVDAVKRYKEIYNHYSKLYECDCIAHNHTAKFVDGIDDLEPTSGGTYISSGVGLAALEILKGRRGKVIIAGDGENWLEDNSRLISLLNNLNYLGIDIIYHEIATNSFSPRISTMLHDRLNFNLTTYVIDDMLKDIFGKHTRWIKTYKVEHSLGGKLYTFVSSCDNIKIGDMVVCDTTKGKTYGRVMHIDNVLVRQEDEMQYKSIYKI